MRTVIAVLSASLVLIRFIHAQEPSAIDYRFYGSAGSETHLTPGNKGSALNPEGILNIPLVSDSSDITLFGDIMAEDKRWKVHFKLRGANDGDGNDVTTGEVDEFYANYSVTSWMDLSVGRKIVNWGTGYGWNPTGVVNPPKDPRDPSDRLDAYKGVDQASVNLFAKGWALTGIAVPALPWPGRPAGEPLALGWAARGYRLIHGLDFAISASGGGALPHSQGLSLSRVFGKSLELHAETAAFQSALRFLPDAGGFEYQRRNYAELLFGLQYTFPRSVNVILEYYHNGGNPDLTQWQQFRQYTQSADVAAANGNAAMLALANQQFSVLNMGRDYLFARVAMPLVPRKLDFETIMIKSLRDGSAIVRPGVYWKLSANWTVYCLETEFLGSRSSEAGFVPIGREADLGFRFHF